MTAEPDLGRGARGDTGIGALPDKVVRELRSAKLSKAAASTVSSAELIDEIRRMSPETLVSVRKKLRLRKAAAPAMVAQSVRTHLIQAPDELAALILREVFTRCAKHTVATADFDAAEMSALLTGDREALAFLADTDLLTHGLLSDGFGTSRSVRVAVGSSLVSTGHCLPAPLQPE